MNVWIYTTSRKATCYGYIFAIKGDSITLKRIVKDRGLTCGMQLYTVERHARPITPKQFNRFLKFFEKDGAYNWRFNQGEFDKYLGLEIEFISQAIPAERNRK